MLSWTFWNYKKKKQKEKTQKGDGAISSSKSSLLQITSSALEHGGIKTFIK